MTNSQHFARRSPRWHLSLAFLMVSLFSTSGSRAGEVEINTDLDTILHCKGMLKRGASGAQDAVASCNKAIEPFEGADEESLSQNSLNELPARLGNLAHAYQNAREFDKALPLYERALRIREKVNGPEHEETATVLNNLAFLYRNMKQYDKALPLMERAVRIREKVLGPDHERTQGSKESLAAIREELKASAPAQPPKTPAATQAADACTGLSNGQSVRIPVKGYPQPQSALVLDSGGGKVSVRVMGMDAAAGKKLTLACSAARR